MRTAWLGWVVPLVAVAVTGCGIQGKWTLQSIEPESARENYKFANVTLNEDGTYVAEAEEGSATRKAEGKYEYQGGKLTFTDDEGHQHVYDAELTSLGRKLRVKRTWENKEVTAIMKRE